MILKDNPARRLKNILLRTSRYSSGERSTQHIWAHFFKIDEQDIVEVNRHLLMLVDLYREVQHMMDRIGAAGTNIVLRDLEGFERRLLPANLTLSWTSLNTSPIMRALEFCEEVIEKNAEKDEIDEERRVGLYDDVEDLLTKIQESDVSPALKAYIGERLEDIKRALEEYPLRGNTGIRHALQSLIGAVTTHSQELRVHADAFCEGLWSFLTKTATILTLADHVDKLPAIIESFKALLLGR